MFIVDLNANIRGFTNLTEYYQKSRLEIGVRIYGQCKTWQKEILETPISSSCGIKKTRIFHRKFRLIPTTVLQIFMSRDQIPGWPTLRIPHITTIPLDPIYNSSWHTCSSVYHVHRLRLYTVQTVGLERLYLYFVQVRRQVWHVVEGYGRELDGRGWDNNIREVSGLLQIRPGYVLQSNVITFNYVNELLEITTSLIFLLGNATGL